MAKGYYSQEIPFCADNIRYWALSNNIAFVGFSWIFLLSLSPFMALLPLPTPWILMFSKVLSLAIFLLFFGNLNYSYDFSYHLYVDFKIYVCSPDLFSLLRISISSYLSDIFTWKSLNIFAPRRTPNLSLLCIPNLSWWHCHSSSFPEP